MTPAAAEPASRRAEIPRRIVLATHYYATGPALDLEVYLQPVTDDLLFIGHPLFARGGPSYVRRYEAGRLTQTLEKPPRAGRFVADLWRTLRWVDGRWDLFIAGDPLLAIAGLWLRRRRRVRRLVLYSIDYSPRRFSNPVLNRVYHRIDRLAAQHADVVWNVSAAIGAARRARDGRAAAAPQVVVPLGTYFDRIPRSSSAPSVPRLAFLGHLLEKQGLQLVIEALPSIRRRLPAVTLLVLGDGPYRGALERQSANLGVAKAVEFAGFIDDHREVERRLAGCTLGLAPYVPDPDSFSRFADPGKIKTYLACGLPVILTDVPPIALLVEERGAGRIVPYEPAALAETIIDYLSDPQRLERARAAAMELGAEYAWDRVFGAAFLSSAPYLR
ncbi:MAG: glycosyltransferase family 4 protein [Chloroflexi bacterium]|nr:MAG: glycosyltransferase family 4 protein [Chloroflexota bacterium]